MGSTNEPVEDPDLSAAAASPSEHLVEQVVSEMLDAWGKERYVETYFFIQDPRTAEILADEREPAKLESDLRILSLEVIRKSRFPLFVIHVTDVIALQRFPGVTFTSEPEVDIDNLRIIVRAKVCVPLDSTLEKLVNDILEIEEKYGPLHQEAVLGQEVCKHLQTILDEGFAYWHTPTRTYAETWGIITKRKPLTG